MENINYQKHVGSYYFGAVIFLLAVISFGFAKSIAGVGISLFFMLMTLGGVRMVKKEFKQYCRSEELLSQRSMREKLKYILRRRQIKDLYLQYGTPEVFIEFRDYFENLSKFDDFRDDIEDFLLKAQKAKKFENHKKH